MKIYIKLNDFEQNELLTLLPPTHSIAMEIRIERHNAETKAFRLSHEQIEKDVKIFRENGGVIKVLPPDPKPGSLRKHNGNGHAHRNGHIATVRPKLSAAFKALDKDILMALLRKELNKLQPSAQ